MNYKIHRKRMLKNIIRANSNFKSMPSSEGENMDYLDISST